MTFITIDQATRGKLKQDCNEGPFFQKFTVFKTLKVVLFYCFMYFN